MSGLTIRLLEEKDFTEWDRFVRLHPRGSFYHLTAWRRCLAGTFGFIPFYLMAQSGDGNIQGLLPLFLMSDVRGRKSLVSLPFSNYAGLLTNLPGARSALSGACERIAVRFGADYVELRGTKQQADGWPSERGRVNFWLDLRPGAENLWKKSLRSNKRNHIRNAEKNGLRACFGTEQLADFYAVFSMNMKRLGTPPFPLSFFQKLIDVYGTNVEIISIKKGRGTIASMFLVFFNRVMSVPWASSIASFNRLGPNDLMYWTAIEHGCQRGIEFFDMGRSFKDSGTYRFKTQWGAEPDELVYQYRLLKKKDIPSVQEKYGWAISVWKRLPLDWTVLIGKKVIKYFPEL